MSNENPRKDEIKSFMKIIKTDLKANYADVYTKAEVDQKLVGAMDYKGTKSTVSELPTSGNATGDVWHITADGSEWAWNGSAWEELGTAVDLSGYAAKQWVEDKGYLTLADLPVYKGGVS